MNKLQTTRFGEIDINEQEIIQFPKGILGFSEYHNFLLIPVDEKKEVPFYYLQSAEEGDLCFVLLDTFAFFKEYDFELDETTVQEIGLEKPEDVFVLTMVTSKGNLKEATTNLKAPIILNTSNKKAMQVVLEKGDYIIKQPLFNSEQKPNEVVKG